MDKDNKAKSRVNYADLWALARFAKEVAIAEKDPNKRKYWFWRARDYARRARDAGKLRSAGGGNR